MKQQTPAPSCPHICPCLRTASYLEEKGENVFLAIAGTPP